MGRSSHRDCGELSDNDEHPRYAVDFWKSGSASNPWSLEWECAKGTLSLGGASLVRSWKLSTCRLEALFVAGLSVGWQARKQLSGDAIHGFDDLWVAAMDLNATGGRRQHKSGGDGGEIQKCAGLALCDRIEPQASAGSDNDCDKGDDDDDWDTGSLTTSDQHDERGLPITDADRPWFDRLCKLVTAVYNDWSERTTVEQKPVRTHPSRGEKPSGKRPRSSRGETPNPQQSRKNTNKKRKRGKGTARDLEGDDLNNDDSNGDGDDGDDGGGGGSTHPLAESNNSKRTFACPFYKNDSTRYAGCLLLRLTHVKYVKQHLRRSHMRPLFCPSCGLKFTLQDKLEDHIRARGCRVTEFEKPDGINADQSLQLRRRAPVGLTPIDQWHFGVWDVVFPGKARPDTPFVLTAADGIRHDFISFYERYGERLISRYLDSNPRPISSDGVAPPDIAQDSRFIYTVSREVLTELLHLMMQTDANGSTPHEDLESTSATNQGGVLRNAPPLTTTAVGDVATPGDFIVAGVDDERFENILAQHCPNPPQENPTTIGDGAAGLELFNSYGSDQTLGQFHPLQEIDLQDDGRFGFIDPRYFESSPDTDGL